jgi:hypothetical protein
MKDHKDLRDEELTDQKVGIKKDLNRIADGDVSGTLRDSIDEIKADFKAADDKVEDAVDGDDRDNRRY